MEALICQALRGEPAPWPVPNSTITSEEFLQTCEHHGVQALLFHSMSGQPEWIGWPLELRNALEEGSKAGVAQEMLRAHYLRKLLQGFADRGIPCLLTKGEALANTVYPTPGTRTRCDSDLFIRIEDVPTARQAVLDAGFVIVSPIYKTHQFTVRRPGEMPDVFEFDVHWRILNAPRYARALPFNEVWDSSVELPGMASVRTLNAVDTLMLSCMHRLGSDWHDKERLIWIYDIHLLIAAMSPEQLGEFAAKAVRLDVQRSCLQGLTRSQECFGTDLPSDIMVKLAAPEKPRSIACRYARSYLALFIDDWKQLPDSQARRTLVRELFLPSGESLMHKYGKEDRRWLPLLWLRQVFGGLAQRLSLR